MIGDYIPDFVVAGRIIVEIKALKGTDKSHLAQVIGYLAVMGLFFRIADQFWSTKPDLPADFAPKAFREHQFNR